MKWLTKLSQQLKLLIAIVDVFLTFSASIGSQLLSSVSILCTERTGLVTIIGIPATLF